MAKAERSIILGVPGSGKSTLLRFLAIDLLQESPRLTPLTKKWGTYLPVWVPFAFWTKTISAPQTVRYSLPQLLYSWLENWGEERLWPLVERALEDDRLLLLVDGLDEWTNESAAKVALDLFQVFIAQRNMPAVVTSRPYGFERLGMQDVGWQRGYLSDFSLDQQRELSRIWFTYRFNLDSTDSRPEIERIAESEVESFIAELEKSSDLRELAKVPLLLSLFIYHKFHNARLPRNRFKAYHSLIEHLISTHPQKRRVAASLIENNSSELDEDDRKIILAYLAYSLQERSGGGIVDQNDARILIEDYLKADDGFGFGQRKANRYSQEMLEVGEATIGLLVKQSSKEVGFFHRVFQEYLAAYHLSRQPLDSQLSIVKQRCVHPQWHEVILGLFHLTNRAEDIEHFVDCIKQKTVNKVEKYAVEQILCETAFGDFNCSVPLARELAKEVFEQIEFGSWMPHRERLLQHVLDGLRSNPVKEMVRVKLKTWFPCRVQWTRREYIFRAMAYCPQCTEVIGCLWRGIHDEQPNNQRAAARALADLTGDDSEIGNQVASLAFQTPDPKIRAAAIESLLHGWPNHEDIERILDRARHAMSPELRLIAIIGRIQRRQQTEEDWQELIRLGSWGVGLNFHWEKDVALALMNGWPQSPRTKAACLEALQRFVSNREQLELEEDLALWILLEDYPQDEDVAQFCATQIGYKRFTLSLRYVDAWHLLSQNFRDHPKIVSAIDEWILTKTDEVEIATAAVVVRTSRAKAKLLSSLNSPAIHWPARALIEGWGIQDTDVAEKLMPIVEGSADRASCIAHLLPQIITDKTACRKRLLEVLRAPECFRPDFVMDGLEALGNTQGDVEVVDAVLNRLQDRERRFDKYVTASLITNYSSDPRVKELAKQELSKRNGCYDAVAKAYGNDDEIRNQIIEIAVSLPIPLRGVIASHLGEGSGDDPFTMSLLQLYDLETDGEIKTQASISYHKRLKASGQDASSTLETLSDSIVCVGRDYRERREAALCGLVILDRLDIVEEAKKRTGYDGVSIASFLEGLSTHANISLLRHLMQNWVQIRAAVGDAFWLELSRHRSDPFDRWDAIWSFAHESEAFCEEALQFLETRADKTANPNLLHFLGRVRPNSQLLLGYCWDALHIEDDLHSRSGEEVEVAMVAAELLGKHFGGDGDLLAQIASEHDNGRISFKEASIALCEGWPESDELERVFEIVREQRLPLNNRAYFQLLCRKSASDVVFDVLIEALSRSEFPYQWRSQALIRPIIRRLGRDESLFNMLTEHLQNHPTPSEKATLPRLIGAARGVSTELRTWCIEEIDRQLRRTEPPEIGFDSVAGELRPVINALLDVVLDEPQRGISCGQKD